MCLVDHFWQERGIKHGIIYLFASQNVKSNNVCDADDNPRINIANRTSVPPLARSCNSLYKSMQHTTFIIIQT